MMGPEIAEDEPIVTARTVMLWDPSGLLATYGNGALVLHLKAKRNGRLLLKLATSTKILIKEKIRAPFLLADGESPPKDPEKKKQKGQRGRKKMLQSEHRFDWSKYIEDEKKDIQSMTTSKESSEEVIRKKKRKRKKKQRKRSVQRQKRTSSSRCGKNKKRKKNKTSSSSERCQKNGSDDSSTQSVDSHDPPLLHTPTRDSILEAETIQTDDSPAIANPKCNRKTHSTDHGSVSVAVRSSDLRSPTNWEKRRKQIIRSNQGRVKVNVVSLESPFVSVHGYLCTDKASRKDLKETLKGGAFVYSRSGGRHNERRMMLMQQKFFRHKSMGSISRTSSHHQKESDSYMSSITTGSSEVPPQRAPQSGKQVTYLQFDANMWDRQCTVESYHQEVGGDHTTDTTMSTGSSGDAGTRTTQTGKTTTTRLNTLRQIFEHDDDSESNDSSSSHGYHAPMRSSSLGRDNRPQSSQQKEGTTRCTWLGRLREKWTKNSSHRMLP